MADLALKSGMPATEAEPSLNRVMGPWLLLLFIVGDILGIDAQRIGIKATTMEGMGFIGRGEGIAAMASASVLLPEPGR